MTDHILVVDDDPKIRKILKRCFEQEGYRVSEAASGSEARRIIESSSIQLITLDLTLGDEDGLIVARDIRSKSSVPIIMVTGKGDTIDRVVGLEIGADDYIAKPFHLREVLARVRTVMRRSGHQPQLSDANSNDQKDCITFDRWHFDLARRELVTKDGTVCDLTTGEFDLLKALVTNANRVLSRNQIMDLIKGHDWSPTDRTIDNQIARLRKKIEADPDRPTLVKTVRGVGYTFTANIT